MANAASPAKAPVSTRPTISPLSRWRLIALPFVSVTPDTDELSASEYVIGVVGSGPSTPKYGTTVSATPLLVAYARTGPVTSGSSPGLETSAKAASGPATSLAWRPALSSAVTPKFRDTTTVTSGPSSSNWIAPEIVADAEAVSPSPSVTVRVALMLPSAFANETASSLSPPTSALGWNRDTYWTSDTMPVDALIAIANAAGSLPVLVTVESASDPS